MNESEKEATVANGYPLGRPDGRAEEPLDRVIQEAIEKLPMEVRLYPDVYSWRVSEAIKKAVKKGMEL